MIVTRQATSSEIASFLTMKEALASKEDAVLATAFEMLKSHYKFIGVFTVIMLSVYALAAVIGFIGAFSAL